MATHQLDRETICYLATLILPPGCQCCTTPTGYRIICSDYGTARGVWEKRSVLQSLIRPDNTLQVLGDEFEAQTRATAKQCRPVQIRSVHPPDWPAIFTLQANSLQVLCAQDYDPEQLHSLIKSQERARRRYDEIVIVAESTVAESTVANSMINSTAQLVGFACLLAFDGKIAGKASGNKIAGKTSNKISGNKIVGKTSNKISGTTSGKISGMFVHPDFARKGIGTRLVIALEEIALGKQYKTLSVTSSLSAVGFYQALGYKIDRRSGFWSQGNVWIPCMNLVKRL